MNQTKKTELRLALPSKGALSKPTLNFFAAASLKVRRPNERQYVGSIPSMPEVTILFQRAADIFNKVAEGSADLGVTGYDIVSEHNVGHDEVIFIWEKLGYGGSKLVLAVPESWIDVSSIEDIADLAVLFKEKGNSLRIATKFPNLTRKFLYEKGIIHFSLVKAQGALEVAPKMGYADMIVDITSTGTTLRENRLKRLIGGTILKSEACLIGNKRALREDESKLHCVRMIMELIEAHERAKKFVTIKANIRGESPEAIARQLSKESSLAGQRGPTISKVYSKIWGQDDWYAATIVVERRILLEAIYHLRKVGGTDMTVFSPDYLFDSSCSNYQLLIEKLKRT